MTLQASSVSYVHAGILRTTAGGTLTFGAANALLPRWDIVELDASGYVVTAGTPGARDSLGVVDRPARNYSNVYVGAVFVDAAVTALHNVDVDMGVVVPATAIPTGSSGMSSLLADVAMPIANTFYDGPNTGVIGVAGEVWLILAQVAIVGGATPSSITARLTDGTNIIAEAPGVGAATPAGNVTIDAIRTVSAPATYKVQAASTAAGATLKADPTSNSSGAHIATRISWVRLA
jgi:hypothetical protein